MLVGIMSWEYQSPNSSNNESIPKPRGKINE